MKASKTIIWSVTGVTLALTLAAGMGVAAETTAPKPVAVKAAAVKTTVATTTAHPKFENFNSATYKGKLGKVTMPYDGTCTLLLRKVKEGKLGDYLQIQGKEKSVAVPVGTYRMLYYSMTVMDKDGGKWSMVGGPASESKARLMEVKDGGEITLQTGEPLIASVKVTQVATNVTMDFQLIGSNGDKCTVTRIDGTFEKPGFQVLSESGDVLMSGKFEYG